MSPHTLSDECIVAVWVVTPQWLLERSEKHEVSVCFDGGGILNVPLKRSYK